MVTAKALDPIQLRRCPFTQSVPSHTFLLSFTQSMLGGIVSRATKRNLSLTTLQDAEMGDISLLLRCGSAGAYSSTTCRTKQPCPLCRRRKAGNFNMAEQCSWKCFAVNQPVFGDKLCNLGFWSWRSSRFGCDGGIYWELKRHCGSHGDKGTKLLRTYSVNWNFTQHTISKDPTTLF